jgi:hypothetical protein
LVDLNSPNPANLFNHFSNPQRVTRRGFVPVLVLALVLDAPYLTWLPIFSYFNYEDENDDEDDYSTRNS